MSVSGILKYLTLGLVASQALAESVSIGAQIAKAQKPCMEALPEVIFNSFNSALLDQTFTRCSEYFQDSFLQPEFKLIHLAALAGNEVALESLHKRKVDLEATDAYGYTALHHAALEGHLQGVDKLLDLGAKPSTRTPLGATYADLLRFNAPFKEESQSALHKTLLSAHTNDDNTYDRKCFGEGVKLVEEMAVSKFNIRNLWLSTNLLSGKINLTPLDKETIAVYNEFKKNPPKTSVEEIKFDDEGQLLPIQGCFCGLVAKQPIKKGQIVVEYTGEYINANEQLKRPTEYMLGEKGDIGVDAMFFRSAGSMANHGFPNVIFQPIYSSFQPGSDTEGMKGVDGFPNRTFLVAIEDIAEGEEIILNYGGYHPQKKSMELRPKAIKKFFEKFAWNQLYKYTNGLSSSENFATRVSYMGTVTQFSYFLESSESLKNLARMGLLVEKDIKSILKLAKKYPIFNEGVLDLNKNLRKAEKFIAKMAAKSKTPPKDEL